MKLAHIINPFRAKETQDLFLAQPITLKTMETAQDFSRAYGLDVELYAVYYPEDEEVVPSKFIKTPPLDRSVLDVAKIQFKVPRRFPLLRDILDRIYVLTNADYLIYSNVDIALMPFFYVTIAKFIEKGFDGFSITRRTISKDYKGVEDIPLMYSEYGKNHPGQDCFVFKRDHYPSYQLFDVCVGAGGVGKAMLYNVICNAQKFRVFRNVHLTFHLGDDRRESVDAGYTQFGDYGRHNIYQVRQSIKHYQAIGKLSNHRIIQKFLSTQAWTKHLPDFEENEI